MSAALAALEQVRASNFPALVALPAALRDELAPLLTLRRCSVGRTLFAQGAPVPALFAVITGEVVSRFTAPDGQVSVMEHVQPPRLFGLGAFACGLPSRYEAAATRPSQLLVIGPAAYAMLMDRWPGFARALLAEFARRFDGTLHQLESARHRSAAERLGLALHQLRRERGEALPGGGWQVRASQTELAQLAGVTRQTANAWLRDKQVVVAYRCLRGN